jgi:hypothetical protein
MTNKKAAKDIRAQMKGENACDKRHMSKLAKLIETGKYADAYKWYRGMDTFVREIIPDDVVSHLECKNAGGVRTVTANVRLKDCKKVFKDGWLPGVVARIPLDFPKNVRDEQIAITLIRKTDEVLAEIVEVLYTEGDSELCTIDTAERH